MFSQRLTLICQVLVLKKVKLGEKITNTGTTVVSLHIAKITYTGTTVVSLHIAKITSTATPDITTRDGRGFLVSRYRC